MTPEQIEKWTRQASAIGDANELSGDAIAEFARLVAQDTWERAAKVCDRMAGPNNWSAAFVGHPDAVTALTETAQLFRAEAAQEAKS